MSQRFFIDPDITKAETLPADFYRDAENFDLIREKIFNRTWQWIGSKDLMPQNEGVYPLTLLDGFMKEPLLLTKDSEEEIRCLSNVCTHRANILAHQPAKSKSIICAYHGRKFDLEGKFVSMPEFNEAENFPRPCDSLHTYPLKDWRDFLFVSPDPAFDFNEVINIMEKHIGFLPIEDFKFEPTLSKDYLVNAHWALYCDNYLEGFHIPFVHKDLNNVLDYGSYTTLLYDHCNVQVGYSKGGEEIFDLPEGHVDYSKQVGAYYYWVFPNMMFNFYPWGLSINIVKPITKDKTKVSFLTYVYDESKLGSGAGALLDKVEREDEFVVEGVHQGLMSSAYTTGRFSPKREKGVHHFHGLLAKYVSL